MLVEPQSSSFSNNRSLDWADSQEEMRYEGSPVKAPPPSRRRVMPSTPQSPSTSIEEIQWQTEMEVNGEEEGWISLLRAVMHFAVLCCGIYMYIYIYIYAFRSL